MNFTERMQTLASVSRVPTDILQLIDSYSSRLMFQNRVFESINRPILIWKRKLSVSNNILLCRISHHEIQIFRFQRSLTLTRTIQIHGEIKGMGVYNDQIYIYTWPFYNIRVYNLNGEIINSSPLQWPTKDDMPSAEDSMEMTTSGTMVFRKYCEGGIGGDNPRCKFLFFSSTGTFLFEFTHSIKSTVERCTFNRTVHIAPHFCVDQGGNLFVISIVEVNPLIFRELLSKYDRCGNLIYIRWLPDDCRGVTTIFNSPSGELVVVWNLFNIFIIDESCEFRIPFSRVRNLSSTILNVAFPYPHQMIVQTDRDLYCFE